MRFHDLNLGWQLQQGERSGIPMLPVTSRSVDLPHDFMIESDVCQNSKNGPDTGFYPGGTVTYTKTLAAPQDWQGQRVLFACDGCYGNTRLTVLCTYPAGR